MSIFRHFAICFLSILPSFFYSQEYSPIALPEFEDNEAYLRTIEEKTISVFITNEHHVYVGEKRVLWWDAIVPALFKALNRDTEPENLFFTPIVIQADKRASYEFVDRVKEELARCEQKQRFIYQLGSDENPYYLQDRVHGTTKEKVASEPIGVRDKKILYIEATLPDGTKLNSRAISVDQDTLGNKLYEAPTAALKGLVPNQDYSILRILPEKRFLFQNQEVKLDVFRKFMGSDHKVLVTFDPELTYEDFIYYVSQKTFFARNSKGTFTNKGLFIDISYSLEKLIAESLRP